MEALKLTRKDYNQGLENLAKGFVNIDENYLSLFEV